MTDSPTTNCTPAQILESDSISQPGRKNYIVSASGPKGERINAFVEGTITRSGDKLTVSADSQVHLMGAAADGSYYPNARVSQGDMVNNLMTRAQMLDPDTPNYVRNPELAARIRAAASDLASCSNVGPAVDIISADPRRPLETPAKPLGPVKQKE